MSTTIPALLGSKLQDCENTKLTTRQTVAKERKMDFCSSAIVAIMHAVIIITIMSQLIRSRDGEWFAHP